MSRTPKPTKTSKIVWWLCVSWWWYPLKWTLYTIPVGIFGLLTGKGLSGFQHTVYISSSGTKYHYNKACSGGNYETCKLGEAKRRGIKPCENCVNH